MTAANSDRALHYLGAVCPNAQRKIGTNIIMPGSTRPDVPEKVRAIIPMLVCCDAVSEIEFCKTTFGAMELSRRSGPDGTVIHATLQIGEVMIMVHAEVPTLASRSPQPDGSSPVVIYVYTEDVDSVIGRGVVAGARILIPVTNAFWGDRVGRMIDPSGHVWNVATRAVETKNPKESAPVTG